MDKKPSPKAEALARQLQEQLRQQRPHWHRWAPLLTVVMLVALAALAWWLYPSAEAPRLTITAFDALQVAGETTEVSAVLEPQDTEAKAPRYSGLEVAFWDERVGVREAAPRRQAKCDEQGRASVALEPAGPLPAPFYARHLSAEKKYETKDRAHLFGLAKETPLLLVEVEETLAELEPGAWAATNPMNIPVRGGAASALRVANTEHGWHVAYLTLYCAQPKEYRRVRGWVETKSAGADPLPRGPVLGRWTAATMSEAGAWSPREARAALLRDLQERALGKLAAIVRTAEAAEQCQQLGIRALATGGGDFPAEIVRLKSWSDLPAALGK
jgi:hypothetical protein